MRRREVIALIAGATAAGPAGARTETSRRVGLLITLSAQAAKVIGSPEAIVQGLRNTADRRAEHHLRVSLCRWQTGCLAKARRGIGAIASRCHRGRGHAGMQAAKDATQTVPIVGLSNDPLASGFVSSLGRPGGNITGIGLLSADLTGRRLQLLSEVVVGLARVAVLLSTANPSHFALLKQTQAAGPSLRIEVHVAEAGAPDLLESAFATISAAQTGALIVLPDAMFFGEYRRVVALAATERLPTLYPEKQSVEAGGLMAYWPEYPCCLPAIGRLRRQDFTRRRSSRVAGRATDDVREFAINLKTAKTLGLSIPDKLLYTADEVIE